jgi:hypothetical protein
LVLSSARVELDGFVPESRWQIPELWWHQLGGSTTDHGEAIVPGPHPAEG